MESLQAGGKAVTSQGTENVPKRGTQQVQLRGRTVLGLCNLLQGETGWAQSSRTLNKSSQLTSVSGQENQ